MRACVPGAGGLMRVMSMSLWGAQDAATAASDDEEGDDGLEGDDVVVKVLAQAYTHAELASYNPALCV